MKKIVLILLLLPVIAVSQGSVDFENAELPSANSYEDGEFTENGITYYYYHSRNQQEFPIDGEGLMLRRASDSYFEFTIPNGVGDFSFEYRKAFTGGAVRQLELIVDGEQVITTDEFGDIPQTEETDVYTLNYSIDLPGSVTIKIKNVGETSTNRQTVIDNIVWTEYIDDTETCESVTNVSVDDITETSAEVTWQAGDEETTWEVTYGPAGFDINTSGTTVSTSSTSYLIEGLEEGTQYDVYVRAICGEENESDWNGPNSFMTDGEVDCSSFTVSISGDLAFCVGGSTTLTIGSGYENSDVSWSTGSQDTAIEVTEGGTYSVFVTNENGCEADATVDVIVNVLPEVTATPENATICEGESIELNASGADSYAWDNGLGSGASQEVSPSTNTTYTVTGTDENGCEASASVEITVDPLPTVDGIITDQTEDGATNTFSAVGATNVDDFFWDFGDGNTSTEESPTHTYSESGNYEVTLTVSNDCGEVSVSINVSVVLLGISANDIELLSVYPNPATDKLTVELKGNEKIASILVVNILGEVVTSQTAHDSTKVIVSTSELTNGIYFVQIALSDGTHVVKKIEVR